MQADSFNVLGSFYLNKDRFQDQKHGNFLEIWFIMSKKTVGFLPEVIVQSLL